MRIGPTVKQKTIKSGFTTVRKFISLLLSFNLIRPMFLSITFLPILPFYPISMHTSLHIHTYMIHIYVCLHGDVVQAFTCSVICIKPKKTIAEDLGFIILSCSTYTSFFGNLMSDEF